MHTGKEGGYILTSEELVNESMSHICGNALMGGNMHTRGIFSSQMECYIGSLNNWICERLGHVSIKS